MRLLFLHHRFGALGGAEANILATGEELQRRGHPVGLAHGDRTGRGDTEWQEAFPERFPIPAVSAGAAVTAAVAQFQPDVVFLHTFSAPAVLQALLTCGRPVIRMVHDHDLYCMRTYKYHPLNRHICRRAASAYCVFPCGASLARNRGPGFPLRWISYRAKRRELELHRHFHRLIVASRYMRDELQRNGFPSAQIEIHSPVPRPAPSAAPPLFSARNLIVYAGQIVRGKGVDVLLESLARVRTPFEGAILGDGSHRAHCERLSADLGLDRRVRFAGFVPQAKIAEYYRHASLAVMSSLWPEPFGATGLEAMRCGLPVVAFDAGGIGEWLLDGITGFLVPWRDRAAFAARVETLLRDKALARRLGATGRRIADERFSFSTYLDGLEDLLARTAAARTAAAPPLAAFTL